MFARLAVCAVIAVFAVAGSAAESRATTVVVPTDAELALASRSAVEGTVSRIRSRRAAGVISTYVELDVTTVFFGDAQTGRLVLKQMGGTVGDDFSFVYGSPEYTVGERVVVFLNTDDDGAWHTAFMFLGKYSVSDVGPRTIVTRAGAGAGTTAIPGGNGATTNVGDYVSFVAAIRRDAFAAKRDVWTVAAHAVPVELATAFSARDEVYRTSFTLMHDHTRWFEPDDGQPVPYEIRLTTFLPDGGMGAVTDALAAWSTVPGCSLRLELVDDTENCGFVNDGVSTVSFDDCRGQVDGGGCFGVIAIGGASGKTSEHRTINGTDFVRITDADVVMNNGQETCLLGHRLTVREVLTHELGHSIGLGHSSESGPEPNPRLAEATMYYQLHEDDRGATIKPDDVDGVTFIYPASEVAPVVATETLAPASQESAYETQLAVTWGEAPFVWSLSSGALPDGLALGSTGEISGTPTRRGDASFTVSVTDARGRAASRDLSLSVLGPKPSVSSIAYKPGRKLTLVAELRGGHDVSIVVNGVRVTPPAKLKMRADSGSATRLIVKGTAEELNVTGAAGSNTIVVVVDGSASDAAAF